MFSLEAPTPVMTTGRATRGPRTPWSMGLKPTFPPETLLESPRVQPSDGSMQERLQRKGVDSISELRCQATTRNAHCNQAPMHYGQQFMHSREPRVRT
jgi:hypothetical protein